nr:hypothetical protein OH826_02245 [Streptomyces sp. NBC_00899]WSX81155.1 hypothetical protein OH826_49265 [Streptomyces sp. NBC_00899]
MSYDLEWVDLPEPAASGRARYDACDWLDAPPCPHDPPCLDTYLTLAAPYQFHVTIFSMDRYIAGMHWAGMCFDAEPQPFTARQYSHEEWPAASPAEQQAYCDARLAYGAQRVPGRTGIPVFKLTSNGPWTVTAEEIEEALTAHDAAPAELHAQLASDNEYWPLWVDWLRTCREHGGFRLE